MRSRRDFNIEEFDSIEQPDGSYLDNDGDISWFNDDGEWHKEEGPALIYSNGDVEWYLNGKIYSFADWLIELANVSDEAKMMLRLQYA
jgi:hypothetical protein